MRKTGASNKKQNDGPIGPYDVGDVVVIRAIPFHYIGKIERLGEHAVTLEAGAVWLADSSRWGDCLNTGKVNESEPYPNGVSIRYDVVGDTSPWPHAIPGQV